MKQALLLSVQPKWLQKILNGEKTIEIRKTMPKCELPTDVYLYCTKDTSNYLYDTSFASDDLRSYVYYSRGKEQEDERDVLLNGKVVAKFTLKIVDKISNYGNSFKINNDEAYTNKVARQSCLDFLDLKNYSKGKDLFAWHIEDLVIFNEPMGLDEFGTGYGEWVKDEKGYSYVGDGIDRIKYRLTRAPQSWQYVYVEKSQ